MPAIPHRHYAPDTDAASVLAGQAAVVDAVLDATRVFVAIASDALVGIEPELTLPQLRAVTLVEAHGGTTIAQLAETLGVVPSTASRMCARLVAKKLLRRAADRGNRRQVHLSVLPEGRRVIAQSTERRKQQLAELLARIPAEQQASLAAGLRPLTAAAGSAPPAGPTGPPGASSAGGGLGRDRRA